MQTGRQEDSWCGYLAGRLLGDIARRARPNETSLVEQSLQIIKMGVESENAHLYSEDKNAREVFTQFLGKIWREKVIQNGHLSLAVKRAQEQATDIDETEAGTNDSNIHTVSNAPCSLASSFPPRKRGRESWFEPDGTESVYRDINPSVRKRAHHDIRTI